MKRSRLERKTPLQPGKGLQRTVVEWGASERAYSTHHNQTREPKPTPKRRSTGPTAKVRALVRVRSGGWCEWAGCWLVAAEQHHRLGRKSGGRRGDAADRLNQASNLLDVCRMHHSLVTSAHGANRKLGRESGWLLEEHEAPRAVPVLSRHGRVWLCDDGSISLTNPHLEEEAA